MSQRLVWVPLFSPGQLLLVRAEMDAIRGELATMRAPVRQAIESFNRLDGFSVVPRELPRRSAMRSSYRARRRGRW